MSYVILTQHQRLEGSTLPPWHGQNGGIGHGRDRAKEFEGQIAAMAILVLALLLTGCGKEAAVAEKPSAECTGPSMEQTVSVNVEEPETTDTAEETPDRFQYDEKLFALVLPVVTEEQSMAEGKTLLTLQPNLPNTWLKNAVAGFNRQSADYKRLSHKCNSLCYRILIQENIYSFCQKL